MHRKLYLFGRRSDGIVTRQRWIRSSNSTEAGFGGHSKPIEEVMLQVGAGERADALADQFQDWYDHYATGRSVSEVIREYTEDRMRNTPHSHIRKIASGVVPRRDLLDKAHRPRTFAGYQQALKECEQVLRNNGWEIFNPRGPSYVRVISRRRKLLLGHRSWSQLGRSSRRQLMGLYRANLDWWGLMGRVRGSHVQVVLDHETKIRASLQTVVKAHNTEFPEIAVDAMRELTTEIKYVGHGTATLFLTLARPDRLLSLNGASEKGFGALLRKSPSTLRAPENYRELLRWLYEQPWYADGPPANEDLEPIWRVRAALVDAFVWEPAS